MLLLSTTVCIGSFFRLIERLKVRSARVTGFSPDLTEEASDDDSCQHLASLPVHEAKYQVEFRQFSMILPNLSLITFFKAKGAV